LFGISSLAHNSSGIFGRPIPAVYASAEDVNVDVNIAFVDGFVSDALANGARPYDKPQEDDDDEDDDYGMVTPSTPF
jgi:hypothetical protein